MKRTLILLMPAIALIAMTSHYINEFRTPEKPFQKLSLQASKDVTISRALVNEAFENLPKLLKEAKAVPYVPDTKTGRVTGYKIVSVKPGSLYQVAGLEAGDVIIGSNGEPIDTPQEAMRLYQTLKQKQELQLEIVRRGERQNLYIKIQ